MIELLEEGKEYGAQCLCDTIDQRYQNAQEVNEQCRTLLSDIEAALDGDKEIAVSDLASRYKELSQAQ